MTGVQGGAIAAGDGVFARAIRHLNDHASAVRQPPPPVTGQPPEDACRVRVGVIEIELRSVLREVLDDFAHLYRGWRVDGPAGPEAIRVEVRAGRRSRWGRRRYAVHGDGEELFADLSPPEVLPFVEWGINYRVIATRGRFLQLHSATMASAGVGVLLVGPSGSGKSTLTTALAARGWTYLSDEFALIDERNLRAYPFPKALCVKAGSFGLAESLGLPLWRRRPYVKAFKGRVGYVSPHDVQAAAAAVPIGLIVFPSYTGASTVTVRPISRTQAVFSLAANAFNRGVFGDRVLDILGRLVGGAECVAVESGDLGAAVANLERLIPESVDGGGDGGCVGLPAW